MNETTQKRQGNFLTRRVRKQIFIPLAALLLLIVFNLIADPSFFAITLKENSLGGLSDEKLRDMIESAIKAENYELASKVKQEMDKRGLS